MSSSLEHMTFPQRRNTLLERDLVRTYAISSFEKIYLTINNTQLVVTLTLSPIIFRTYLVFKVSGFSIALSTCTEIGFYLKMFSQLLYLNIYREEPVSLRFLRHLTPNHISSADSSTFVCKKLLLLSSKSWE